MNDPIKFEDFSSLDDITIVDFDSTVTSPWGAIPEEIVVAGEPSHEGKVFFRDPSGRLSVGTWVCTPGKFNIEYDGMEACRVLRGRAKLTNKKTGKTVELKAGDTFIVPFQAKVVWDVLEEFQKFYVMYETEWGPSRKY